MKHGYLVFAFAIIIDVLPAYSFEMKNSERRNGRLKIELEVVPSPVQKDFDNYVKELAAAARRDVDSPPEKKDTIKELQAKAVNPMVFFHW